MSKKISFRINNGLSDFLDSFCRENGMTITDICKISLVDFMCRTFDAEELRPKLYKAIQVSLNEAGLP